jgi:nitrite reductase (NADH) small subunit/3-phenylpropionate/trans-cinnamate dioxygenase ferredoxin subunit
MQILFSMRGELSMQVETASSPGRSAARHSFYLDDHGRYIESKIGVRPAGGWFGPARAGSRKTLALSSVMYHTVARVGEITEGRGVPVEIDGRAIAVFLEGGTYYAIDDTCPHQGAPLADGIVYEGSVTCAWHGRRFSLEDGRALDSPGSRHRVGSYPVRVVGDEIQVATC